MSERGRKAQSPAELRAFMEKVEKLRSEGLNDRTVGERLGVARNTIVDRRRRWLDMLEAEALIAQKPETG